MQVQSCASGTLALACMQTETCQLPCIMREVSGPRPFNYNVPQAALASLMHRDKCRLPPATARQPCSVGGVWLRHCTSFRDAIQDITPHRSSAPQHQGWRQCRHYFTWWQTCAGHRVDRSRHSGHRDDCCCNEAGIKRRQLCPCKRLLLHIKSPQPRALVPFGPTAPKRTVLAGIPVQVQSCANSILAFDCMQTETCQL